MPKRSNPAATTDTSRAASISSRPASALVPKMTLEALEARVFLTVTGFQSAANYTAGTAPSAIATGDFTNNGRADLVVANQTSGTVSVFLSNANGTFQTPITLTDNASPDAVAVGDFVGNGDEDIAVANHSTGTVSVWLGNGNGSFSSAATYSLGSGSAPDAIVSADLNNDGRDDLAVGTFTGGNVVVLLANSNGTTAANAFTVSQSNTYSLGVGINGIAAGQLTSDGYDDLAVTNVGGTVTILHNDETGHFTTSSGDIYNAGISPAGVVIGNFREAGDIAVADNGDGTSGSANVTLLLNSDGAGDNYQADPSSPYLAGANPSSIVAADFNNDGKTDLAVTDDTDNTVSLLYNINSGSGAIFASAVTVATGTDPTSIATGDFTGSGLIDIAAANKTTANVSVLLHSSISVTGDNQSATEGASISGATVATFSDTDPNATAGDFTAQVNWGDGTTTTGTVSSNGSGGFNVTASHAFYDQGSYTMTVTVADTNNDSAQATASATVADAALSASALTITPTAGASFTGPVATFTDADPNGAAKFQANSDQYAAIIAWGDGHLTVGAITYSNGVFDVSGTHTYTTYGTFSPRVTIEDEGGSTVAITSTANVADAAITAAGTTLTGTEGSILSGTIGTFTDANPYIAGSAFTATLHWGDGNTSTGTIVTTGTGQFSITASHTYSDAGSYTLSFTVSDPGGSSSTTHTSVSMANAALTSALSSISATEGTSYTGTVATFTDANTSASANKFTAVITWPDSTTSNGTIAGSGGSYSVTIPGGYSFNTPGSVPVSVLITGAGGGTTTASGNATVANAGVTVSGGTIAPTEGTSFTGTIGTFTDANTNSTLAGSAYSASITWDDSTTTNATVTATGNGGYAITATHTFAHAGTKSYSISVTGPGLSSAATGTGTANVANATLSATASTVSASNGNPFSGVVATFTDSNTLATATDFDAAIHWGDNSSSWGTITSQGGGNFTVFGTHTWADPGTPTITINLAGNGGWSAAPSASATVTDSPIVVTALGGSGTEGSAWTGTIATFTDGNPSAAAGDFTSSINWGDGDTADTSATITESNGVFSVAATHTYDAPGTFIATVTVTDNHSQSANNAAAVTVAYATVTPTLATLTATEGAATTGAVATFTTANTAATASEYSATITGPTIAPITITDPSQVTWTQLGSSQTIAGIGSSALAGLAISNANSGTLASATFGHFSLTTAPSAPTLLATSDVNQVDLTWNPVAGAASYDIYRGTSPGGEGGTPYLTGLTTTSDTDTSVTAGTTYYYTIQAINTVGTSASSTEASATPTDAGGLLDADIGSPTYPGSASYTNGTYTVSGYGDIGGPSDVLNYDSTTANGDATLVTQVDSQTDTNGYAKAGLMFRDSSADDAMQFLVAGTPGHGYQLIYRTATGGTTAGPTTDFFDGSGWLKIVRSGDSFSAYYSSQNTNSVADVIWTQIGTTQTISMSTSAQAGLFVTSRNGTSVSTATFGNFSLTAAPSAPTVLATGQEGQVALNWTPVPGAASYDVYRSTSPGGEGGTPYAASLTTTSYTDSSVTAGTTYYYTVDVVNTSGSSAQSAEVSAAPTLGGLTDAGVGNQAGSASYSSGIYTVSGSGEINSVDDVFNFDSAAANGDTTLVTEVDTQADVSGWAKAGLTIRNSANGADPAFSILATPGNGVQLMWRTANGAGDNQVGALSGESAPVWLKIVRSGDVFTAYYSTQTTITTPTISQLSPGVFQVNSSLLFNQAGSQPVSVTITDPSGQTTLATISGTAAVTSAGITVTGGSIAPTQGSDFNGTVATFSDANVDSTTPAGDYTATITWDNTSVTTGTVASLGNGEYSIAADHTFDTAGTVGYSISVDGPGMASAATATGTATVASASMQATVAPISTTEGTPWSGTIATLSSADTGALNPGTDYTATLTWDDSTTSVGTVTALTDGTYSITSSHTFDNPGTPTESISVTGPGLTSPVTASATIAVASAGVTVTGGSIAPTEGSAFTGTIGTFTDANTNTTAPGSAYTAAITWDSGATTDGTVTALTNGEYSITASHTFEDPGSQTYSISVTGAGLSTAATATGSAAVANAGISGTLSTISATEGAGWSGTVATFADANTHTTGSPNGYVATITWDDSTTSAGQVDPVGNSGEYAITSSHVFQTPGSAPVSIVIAGAYDGLASPVTISGHATVSTAELDVSSAGTLSFTEGTGASNLTLATFTTADTHRVSGDFSATVNWGDNTGADSGTSIQSLGDETYAVVAAGHTYASAASYTYTVDVSEGTYQTQSDTGTAQVGYATISNPTIASITATEGTPWSGTIATFTDSASGAVASEFEYSASWSGGSVSDQTPVLVSPGVFAVVLSDATFAHAGTNDISVAIQDTSDNQLSATSGTVYIDNAAIAATVGTYSATEGNTYSGVVGTFTDANTLASAADFSATVTWGDGTQSTGTDVAISQTSPGNFQVVASHEYTADGPYTLSLSVAGLGDGSDSATGSMTVSDADIAVTGKTVSSTEGQQYSGTIATFTDTDATLSSADFNTSIDWGDNSGADTSATVVADSTPGVYDVIGTHTYSGAGTFTPTISVTHTTGGASNSGSATVDVAYATVAATLSTITADEGVSWGGTVATFTDSNASAPVGEFAATITWPGGVSTSTGTVSSLGDGEFAVTVANHTFNRAGSRTVGVAITDSGDTTTLATASGSASIISAGVTVAGGSIDATQGTPFTGTIATFTDAYAGTTTPANAYTATITWDDGSSTSGTITATGSGVYSVAATHTFQTAGNVGYTVSVSGPGLVSAASDTGAADVASAAVTATIAPVSTTEGTPWTGTIATFSNADTSALNAGTDYTAVITWNNGANSTISPTSLGDGQFAVVTTHTFNHPGTPTESISITGAGLASPVTASAAISVANAGVTIAGATVTPTQGSSYTGTVATFSDANANSSALATDYSATITWSTGATSAGTITSQGGGNYSISATNTFQLGGNQPFTISVTGAGLASAAAGTGTANVTNAGISSGAFTIDATEGSAFSGSIVSFTNSDTSAADPGSAYTASINWGDGLTSTGTVTSTGSGGYTISGSHLYNTAGSSLPISVSVSGAGLASPLVIDGASNVASAGITAALSSVTATEGTPFTGAVATFADNDTNTTIPADAYTATITWSDNTTSGGTIVAGTGGSYTVNAGHTFNAAGLQPIGVAISGPGGATATASGNAAVTTAGLTATLSTIAVNEGGTFTGTVATFTDADAQTTSHASDYSALISWAGGTPVLGTITSLGSGEFAITGSHTFTAAGTPSVAVDITGPGGGLAFAVGTATVTSGTLSATASTISTSEATAFSGTVATFSDAYTGTTTPAGSFAATITWGDSSSSAGTVTSLGNGEFSVAGSHTYFAPGPFTVGISILGPGSGSASTSTTATVTASPLSGASAAITATEGAAWTGTVATITSADLQTTVPAGALSAVITWPDNSTSSGAITESSTGVYVVTGSYTFHSAGSQPVSVAVTGPGGTSAQASDTATVASAGVNATMSSITATEGSLWTGTVATFSDADTLTTTAASSYTATITWDDTTTTVGTITAIGNGHYAVTASHTFNTPGVVSESISVTGPGMASPATSTRAETIANAGVTVTGGSISPTEGTLFSGAIGTFTDANSTTTLPGSAYTVHITWDDGTTTAGTITADGSGVYTISAQHTFHHAGAQTYSISVTNGGLTSAATGTGAATVANGGISGSVSSISATEGTPFTGTIATFSDADTGSTVPAIAYTATITWDNGTTLAGTVTATGNGSYAITATHTFHTAGTDAVSISVSGPGLASSLSLSGNATVASAGITATLGSIQTTEGSTFTGTVATFADADTLTTTPASAYTAHITWDDGTTTVGTIAGGTGGVYAITASHTFDAAGLRPITVSITGPGGAAASATGNAGIATAGITGTLSTISVAEGSTFTGTVATFTDTNAQTTTQISDYSAAISWNGGTPVLGTISSLGNGEFAVTGSYTFTAAGTPPVAVDITGPGNGLAYAIGTATVTSGTLSAAASPLTGAEGVSVGGTIATFSDSFTGTTTPASAFTASINWGDNDTTPGIVTALGNGQFSVGFAHLYTAPGTYTVGVSITGPGGGSATASTSATISAAALTAAPAPITATQGTPWTGTVAQVTSADPISTVPASALTVTITWPGGATSPGTVTALGPGIYVVTGTNTFHTAGNQSVQVAITGPGGTSTSATDTATVASAALSATIATITATEGVAFTGTVATFTDADTAATTPASAYSATISWSDGTTSAGTITAGTGGSYTIAATHTFAHAGASAVSVAITGPGGGSAAAHGTATVANATLASQLATIGATEGLAYSGPLATFTDVNTAASAADFTATVAWGTSTPLTATITRTSAGAFSVSYPAGLVITQSGTVPISVVITGAGGGTTTASGNITVNAAGILGTLTPITPTEGIGWTGQIARFYSQNASAPASAYGATITWEDGTTTTGLVLADSSGGFDVEASHTFAHAGYAQISVAITGPASTGTTITGYEKVASATVTIANQTVTPTEGTQYTGTLATFSDANTLASPSDFTSTITWSDGTTSTGTVEAGAQAGTFAIVSPHVFAHAGNYPVHVTVTSASGASVSTTETAAVGNAALTSSASAVTSVAGAAFAGTVATFSDANLAAFNTDFLATVNFGDGSGAVTGTIASLGNGKFSVIGSHTYTRFGSYPISVSISGAGGGTSTASGTATVTNASLASSGVTITESKGVGFTTLVGVLYSANPYLRLADMTGTINWGDKLSSSVILQSDPAGGYEILGSHTYAALGKFNVSISLAEAGGGTTSVTSFITVNTAVASKPPKVGKTPKPKKTKTKAPKKVKTPKAKKSDKEIYIPFAA